MSSVIGSNFLFEGGSGGASATSYQLPSWDIGTPYSLGALTSYNGVIYRALGATTGDQPNISPLDWEVYQALGTFEITDPAINAAVNTATVDGYDGVIITLTAAGNAQTLQAPTNVTEQKTFTVTNKSTSVSTISINGTILVAGKTLSYLWDGSAWTQIGGDAAVIRIPLWGIGTTYSTNDLVAYTGRIYRAIAPTTGNQPNTSPASWELYNNTPLVFPITDPAINAAVTTAIVDGYNGVLVTTTAPANAQTIQAPTNASPKVFFVSNNDTSTDVIVVNGYTIGIGSGAQFSYDGTAWLKIESPLHNDLSGRSIASAHPSTAISTDTTNFNGALSATETTNQLSLDRLESFDYVGDWATGLAYRIGNVIAVLGKYYRANTAHTASALFATDVANWDLVSSVETWTTGRPYKVDQLVVINQLPYRCNTAHVASAAFVTDIANWDLVKGLETWVTGHAYKVDQFVINNNTLYRANTAHTAGATFAGDVANWDLISAPSSLTAWAPATLYSAGATVQYDFKDYVCITAHTSSAAFVTDLNKWSQNAPENYIAFDKAYGATLTGWATYADAAGTLPVDGTGGAANITWAQNTTTPLNGSGDFRLVKDAANRQGQGVSYDFVIAPRHYSKVLQVSFDYEIISGTYADSDIKVAVIDTTSGAVIELVDSRLFSAVVGQKPRYIGTFQTSNTGTTYRLCVHVSSVNAVAYTLDFNNFTVWGQNQSVGAIITDWTDYTMTIGATTTPGVKGTPITVDKAQWRRNGSNMEIRYDFNQTGAGTAGTGTYLFPLPFGSIDTTKAPASIYANNSLGSVGYASMYYFGPTLFKGTVQIQNATNLYLALFSETTAVSLLGSTFGALGNAALGFSFFASVPISGWGSSVVMSSDTDTRVVSMTYSNNSANTTGGTDGFKCVTKIEDTHNFYNTTTGAITIPVAGTYEFGASITTSGSINGVYLWRVRNGGAFTQVAFMGAVTANGTTATCSYPCLAGDVMYISGNAASTIAVSAQTYANITCFRLSGPSSIAPTETIAARYTHGSGSTVDGSVRICNYETKILDTHGAVTTGASWKFTAPVSGTYYIQGMLRNNTSTSYMNAYIYKNGAAYTSYHTAGNVNLATTSTCFALVKLLAGEYIDYRYDGLAASTSTGEINVYRIGN